jgi:hypothetical protein
MVLSSLRFLCNMVLLILGIVLQQSFTNAFLPSPGSISDMPPSRIIPRSVATHCDDIALLRMTATITITTAKAVSATWVTPTMKLNAVCENL